MAGVLDGIRVLDFGRYIAGPFCAALLGDLGAEVIRIERIGGGEDRGMIPVGAGPEGRRRDVSRDEPQQARDDPRPGGAQGARDRPEIGRDGRCRGRQLAAAGAALASARSRQPAPDQARHHSDDGDRLRLRRADEPQARFRRDRPDDERRGLSVRHARAADRAQGAVGRFRHGVAVGVRHLGGADRARQDRARPEGRGRPAADRDRLHQRHPDGAGAHSGEPDCDHSTAVSTRRRRTSSGRGTAGSSPR